MGVEWIACRLGAWLLLIGGGALAGAPAEAFETPRTARFEGVSLGMDAEAFQRELVSRGFVAAAEDESRRSYVHDATPVYRIVSFSDAPGLVGRVVGEIDYSARYPLVDFDAEAVQREIRERLGEPQALQESRGRIAMLYREVADAPSVGDVVDACRAEIERSHPGIPERRAQIQAEIASEYHHHNRRIGEICPGTLDLYRRFAEGVEAPRLAIFISPRIGTVDVSLRWSGLSTPIDPEAAEPARDACAVPSG